MNFHKIFHFSMTTLAGFGTMAYNEGGNAMSFELCGTFFWNTFRGFGSMSAPRPDKEVRI